jgi:predicted nucleotidyltransferase
MNGEVNIMNKDQNQLYHLTSLKILSFLSTHTLEIFSAREISEQTNSSKGATNQTLRHLLKMDIISREQKGNYFLYQTNSSNVVLKQFKIFETILSLRILIQTIQPYCYQIILYGSCAEGTNTHDSDIDIFIKSEYKDEINSRINKYRNTNLNIQAIVQDPLEIAEAQTEDKVYYEQVKKGIVLWEGRPDDEKF